MTALYLVNQTLFASDRVKLVTFGEPRTGNYLFAKAVEQNLNFRYRVIHQNDAVRIYMRESDGGENGRFSEFVLLSAQKNVLLCCTFFILAYKYSRFNGPG